jgi:hypothetical protein
VSRSGPLSNEAAQGRIRAADKLRQQLLESEIADVLNSVSARKVFNYIVFDLLGLKSVASPDLSERAAAMWEGRRLAAKVIDELLEQHAPLQYDLMVVEARQALRTDQNLRDSAAKTADDGEDDG